MILDGRYSLKEDIADGNNTDSGGCRPKVTPVSAAALRHLKVWLAPSRPLQEPTQDQHRGRQLTRHTALTEQSLSYLAGPTPTSRESGVRVGRWIEGIEPPPPFAGTDPSPALRSSHTNYSDNQNSNYSPLNTGDDLDMGLTLGLGDSAAIGLAAFNLIVEILGNFEMDHEMSSTEQDNQSADEQEGATASDQPEGDNAGGLFGSGSEAEDDGCVVNLYCVLTQG